MELVLNIGNSFLKGGFFEKEKLKATFHLPSNPLNRENLRIELKKHPISTTLVGSDNRQAEKRAVEVLEEIQVPFDQVSHEHLSIQLAVENPAEVGIDRIANVYGALTQFPGKDALIVDMGTAVTFDVVRKDRTFLGGAIYPGVNISAQALNDWTDKLPLVQMQKPPSPISNSTIGNIQSGIYYGLLGAVERIVREMKRDFPQAFVIATGGLTATKDHPLGDDLQRDLKPLMDTFEPELTLLGLYQILKERK